MKPTSSSQEHEIIISGQGLEPDDALRALVFARAEKLFRHRKRILRARFMINCAKGIAGAEHVAVRCILEVRGPDLIAEATAEQVEIAVGRVADKLDRMIRRQARRKKSERHRETPLNEDLAGEPTLA